jgi:hypothetical protein
VPGCAEASDQAAGGAIENSVLDRRNSTAQPCQPDHNPAHADQPLALVGPRLGGRPGGGVQRSVFDGAHLGSGWSSINARGTKSSNLKLILTYNMLVARRGRAG